MAVIETHHLQRSFGTHLVVKGLDLQIEAGEVFGLLGPNGAGKSTVVKMLTTLLPPTGGTATIAGHDLLEEPAAVRAAIGYVPQLLSADGLLTAYENLMLFARLYDIPKAERRSRVLEAIASSGLGDAANRLVNTYSGGMIRRLEIVQSMLHRPKVLFLDEPTIGLDPAARIAVWEQLEQTVRDYSETVFVTTHYMEEADRLCDRIGILCQGELVVVGTPDALKASLDRPDATLEDVFMHYTGAELGTATSGGSYRDAAQSRSTARRLG